MTAFVGSNRNPTDPDLKQQALADGRAYSDLTRSQRGVTVYDELAVANDISAPCAAASAAPPRISAESDLRGSMS